MSIAVRDFLDFYLGGAPGEHGRGLEEV